MPADTFLLGGRPVHRIGFGAMQLPGPGVWGPPRDRDEALAVLRRAVELGVDHIDTAQYYGPDVANALIREALAPYPAGLRVVTKVGALRGADRSWNPALRPEQLRAAVEDNLRSLGLERLDMVNLRIIPEAPAPLAESLGALEDLREEGKLELIGLSNVSLAQLEEGLGLTSIASVQNQFNVLERTDRPVLEACRERGLAYVPFFPLGSAFTGGPAKLAQHPVLREIAAAHDATPAQVALAWLLQLGPHVLLIPGTSSRAHLEENLAAAELELDAEEVAALDALTTGSDRVAV
jgi:aryl-alcohol dehydrogenase-like predicted oxidoreductase